MPYFSVSDVKSLAPFVPITRESQPSEGTVSTWIDDVETIVNSTLAQMGYVVPITSAPALKVLKAMITNTVMAMVMRARPNPESDPESFQRIADAYWKRLKDPNDDFDLEGVEKTVEAVEKGSLLRVSSNLTDLLDESPMRVNRNQVF